MVEQLNLQMKLSVLNLLGPNLYGNIPAVLSELVANAWDADATRVDISIDKDKREIQIDDDGLGISPDDINEKYLTVGYEKRKERNQRFTATGRHVMGRKGVGKLAIFSFARIAEFHTSHTRGKTGFIIDWNNIEENFDKSSYQPILISENKISTKYPSGTKIILKDVDQEKFDYIKDEKKLRMQLGRRFTILDGNYNFNVFINGVKISTIDHSYLNAIEFLWCLGEVDNSEKLFPNLKSQIISLPNVIQINGKTKAVIKGWVGTVDFPSAIKKDENNVISIYANGKLVHENILTNITDITARTFATYIVGNIEADFLDNDEQSDIIIANRREVSTSDKRFIALRDYIEQVVLQQISSSWSTLRNTIKIARRLMTKENQEIFNNLNKSDQQKASSFLKRLSKIDLPEIDAKFFAHNILVHLHELIKIKRLISYDDNEFLKKLRIYEVNNNNTETSDEQNAENENNQETNDKNPNQSESTTATESDSETDQQGKNQNNHAEDSQSNDEGGVKPSVFDFPEGIELTLGPAFTKTSPPINEREVLYKNIKKLLDISNIPSNMKEVALYDLRQSYLAYSVGAYKASCVMLGAVLEGLMISIVLDKATLQSLQISSGLPKLLLNCGITNQNYSLETIQNKIKSSFTYEDYKTVINFLIRDAEEHDKIKIGEIQIFRNIIHPLKIITDMGDYGDVNSIRALNLLSSMAIISKIITGLLN